MRPRDCRRAAHGGAFIEHSSNTGHLHLPAQKSFVRGEERATTQPTSSWPRSQDEFALYCRSKTPVGLTHR